MPEAARIWLVIPSPLALRSILINAAFYVNPTVQKITQTRTCLTAAAPHIVVRAEDLKPLFVLAARVTGGRERLDRGARKEFVARVPSSQPQSTGHFGTPSLLPPNATTRSTSSSASFFVWYIGKYVDGVDASRTGAARPRPDAFAATLEQAGKDRQRIIYHEGTHRTPGATRPPIIDVFDEHYDLLY